MCTSTTEKYGANPANIQWDIVRGDTGILRVDFTLDNETTMTDMTGWTFKSTAYDPQGDLLDELVVVGYEGYCEITAPASTTINWGKKYLSVVAELPFDLQVNIPAVGENIVWTPIIGTIRVLGDISPGGSL